MQPLPIACTLPADELPARLGEMGAVGRASLREAAVNGREAELLFAPDTRERLAELAAAEARCCSFLEFELEEQGLELLLRIEAPPGAEPVLEGLVDAFRG